MGIFLHEHDLAAAAHDCATSVLVSSKIGFSWAPLIRIIMAVLNFTNQWLFIRDTHIGGFF